MNELKAISPIDGRYKSKTEKLSEFFSEAALIKYRVRVEIEYLIALSKEPDIKELKTFNESDQNVLRQIYQNFSLTEAQSVKDKEAIINHDVKAVEYFIKEKVTGTPLESAVEWIHFALTSEDINNIAYALMLSEGIRAVILPAMSEIQSEIALLASKYQGLPMLARTHGQAASPTSFGKEMLVFAERLSRQIKQLEEYKILAKLNGASGNYNAHHIAYPEIDWENFSTRFIEGLSSHNDADGTLRIVCNLHTTQIESHDTYAELFSIMQRFNTILIGFNQDIWRYISDAWISQKAKEEEVGSSTMPHKVNPIDFENSEGNLGLANALYNYFSNKLPISRLQRDLSDSTVLRNFGSALAYSLIAYKSTLKGLSKIEPNAIAMKAALDEHPEIITEAIQTILRREGISVPYEKLKNISRGKKITLEDLRNFIQELDISEKLGQELLKIEPSNYVGIIFSRAPSQ